MSYNPNNPFRQSSSLAAESQALADRIANLGTFVIGEDSDDESASPVRSPGVSPRRPPPVSNNPFGTTIRRTSNGRRRSMDITQQGTQAGSLVTRDDRGIVRPEPRPLPQNVIPVPSQQVEIPANTRVSQVVPPGARVTGIGKEVTTTIMTTVRRFLGWEGDEEGQGSQQGQQGGRIEGQGQSGDAIEMQPLSGRPPARGQIENPPAPAPVAASPRTRIRTPPQQRRSPLEQMYRNSMNWFRRQNTQRERIMVGLTAIFLLTTLAFGIASAIQTGRLNKLLNNPPPAPAPAPGSGSGNDDGLAPPNTLQPPPCTNTTITQTSTLTITTTSISISTSNTPSLSLSFSFVSVTISLTTTETVTPLRKLTVTRTRTSYPPMTITHSCVFGKGKTEKWTVLCTSIPKVTSGESEGDGGAAGAGGWGVGCGGGGGWA
ncbi:hypothetical protein HYALB_00004772 [Hymenoscyphus albidus]|uniref:Uncharacterized protein n=1 Tax=Hymenoscyphus albidus TaxID=595503 RepID=A0A9N9LJZ8_9HELO|nr:hypothetical protein HYALB_00004772 [Hymenoscyphus albidus]